ncbi:MAG: HNH endonuclease, partial [Candidatus Thiodiazotropha taylori]|nr:HNH endonuclease [Candidatus Thiodiazotropha endolucinida]MCW4229103.1 HNH endonuclease [Candidatus Thiodiazotropha taylori]
SVNNLLKTVGNEVMSLAALPERSWATAKGWSQGRNVSLREATGDFDSTIGAIPIVSAIRPSNVPRILRHSFSRSTKQTARVAGESRDALRIRGEASDLPPVPELRKSNSSITIEGSKAEAVQIPVSNHIGSQGKTSGNLNKRTSKKPVATNPTRQASFGNLMADVDKWSLSTISDRQKTMIADKLGTVKQRSKEQVELIRKKGFSRKRQRKLIQQWQSETGTNWPKGATPHHVIPLKSGGANEWWNLMPVKHPHTGTIHGTGSALRTELPYGVEPGTITEIKK